MTNAKTTTLVWILVAAACLSGGCAPANHAEMMQFLAAAHTPTGCDEYRVMPPDKLKITARPTDEFTGLNVQVGPDGKAFLPLIGSYLFANKTTSQIAAELTENLLDYYEDVQVTVSVSAYRSQRFYIWGEVAKPGVYPFTGNDSLLSALSSACPTRMSRPERIVVVRGLDPLPNADGLPVDQQGRIKNRTQKITVNMSAMVKRGESPANFLIANNDVIYVPAHPLAKVGLAFQKILFPIRPMTQTIGSPYDIVDAASGEGTNY